MRGSIALTCSFLVFSGTASAGEVYNHSFSTLGLGTEIISYQENLSIVEPAVATDTVFLNAVQSSSGYVPILDASGFYINTASSLVSTAETETWDQQGRGTIQLNETKAKLAELDIHLVRHFRKSPGFHAGLGANVYSANFTRYAFRLTANAPENLTVLPGAVSEDVTNLSAVLGLYYDSFFRDPNSRLRLTGLVQAGLPLYFSVENSSLPGEAFTSTVTGGFDLGAKAGAGYRLSKNFTALASLEWRYRHRDRIIKNLPDGRIAEAPDNDLHSWRPVVGVAWAF